jgi:hypothetical protein
MILQLMEEVKESLHTLVKKLGEKPDLLIMLVCMFGFLLFLYYYAGMQNQQLTASAAERRAAAQAHAVSMQDQIENWRTSVAEMSQRYIDHLSMIDTSAAVRVEQCHKVQTDATIALVKSAESQERFLEVIKDNTEAVEDMTDELRHIRDRQ